MTKQNIAIIPAEAIDELSKSVVKIIDEIDWNNLINKCLERPKGEWKCTKQGDIPITDRCTNCNYKMKWYKNKHKYCPECGAEMSNHSDY